jgi:hypothetical protein
MTSAMFDFAPLLPAGLPAPAARWTGLANYSFVGGNIDPDQVPVEGLVDAVNAVLKREGVAVLAEVCAKEFGVPVRIANVEKQVRTWTPGRFHHIGVVSPRGRT